MSAQEYLSAADAAIYLGVSRQTLYAYVSRGLVASEPGGDSRTRARRYPRQQLDRLRGQRDDRRLPGRGALRGGTPVLETTITERDPVAGTLAYRGHDAIELSRHASFEEVAALLWAGSATEADAIFAGAAARATPAAAASGARRPVAATRFAEAPRIVDRLYATLVAERGRDPLSLANADLTTLRGAAATVAALFAAAGARGGGPLATALAHGWTGARPGAPAADDIRAALVLCADHGLATSTFTARCIASTDAPIPNVLLGGLCALEGRRHGGHTLRAWQLLADVERDGVAACRRTLQRDGLLPGFWGGGYNDGDPRGRELLARLKPARRDAVARTVAFAAERGLHPTVDLGLAALARAHGLADDAAFALFALGRTAGWIGHALEEARTGTLIRPRAVVTDRG